MDGVDTWPVNLGTDQLSSGFSRAAERNTLLTRSGLVTGELEFEATHVGFRAEASMAFGALGVKACAQSVKGELARRTPGDVVQTNGRGIAGQKCFGSSGRIRTYNPSVNS